jgi:hypothetical protein
LRGSATGQSESSTGKQLAPESVNEARAPTVSKSKAGAKTEKTRRARNKEDPYADHCFDGEDLWAWMTWETGEHDCGGDAHATAKRVLRVFPLLFVLRSLLIRSSLQKAPTKFSAESTQETLQSQGRRILTVEHFNRDGLFQQWLDIAYPKFRSEQLQMLKAELW